MSSSGYSFTTKTRFFINKFIAPTGLELCTTTKEDSETDRLNKLKNKGHWQKEKYFRGLNIDESKYLNFLNEVCLPFKNEYDKFTKVINDPNANSYYLNNEFFGTVDAEVLYSIIRFYKPKNIFEIGSGFSTRVMRMAVDQLPSRTPVSEAPDTPVSEAPEDTWIISIDPQPRIDILNHADEHFAFYVEDLDAGNILNKINNGDILFIDSSHIIATGNDVNYLFLEILPQLPAGIIIHIHDIFFPFDYPEEWLIDERWGWNEQYLVHAFLMFNDTFEIMWPSHYMWIKNSKKLSEFFRPPVNNYKPSSLWIKKIK
jgi:hypothetical protein